MQFISWSRRNFRKTLDAGPFIIVGIPILIFLLPLVALFLLYEAVSFCKRVVSNSSKMRRCGRTLNKEDLERALSRDSGTLITEHLTPGGGWSRAWWTEDNVLELYVSECRNLAAKESWEPFIMEDMTREEVSEVMFYRWVRVNYTYLDTGKARLLKSQGGDKFCDKMLTQFPTIQHVIIHPSFP